MPQRFQALSVPLVVLFALGLSAPRAESAINDSAGIALHLTPVLTHGQCTTATVAPTCANIVTNGDLAPHYYFAYLLVTHADSPRGVAGVQCGIRYNGQAHQGVDVYTWNLCATLDFSSTGWPGSGGGDLITWDVMNKCQRFEPGGPGTGVVAVAGYFYVGAYSADRMEIIPRPVDGKAKLADCNSNEYDFATAGSQGRLGWLSFSAGGALPGYNPCNPTAGGVCQIGGPSLVESGETDLLFSAASAQPGDLFAWSISGNGTLEGPANESQVRVTAGAIGAFQLNLDLTRGGTIQSCWTIVTVAGASCLIQGPAEVLEESVGNRFTVSRVTPADGLHWSITGQGLITSGLTDSVVTVTAATPGAFYLSVTSDATGLTCQRAVAVTSVPCSITGPDPVPSFEPGLTYACSAQPAGTSYVWTLSGDAALAGPVNGPTVHVSAGAVGAFSLRVTVTRSTFSQSCYRTVTVVESGRCPGSQADARILLHLRPVTTRNACLATGAPACADVHTAGALYPTTYYAYLLVCNGNASAGIAGVECGLQYDDALQSGVDIYSWSLCGTMDFKTSDWPASGSGNRITWDAAGKCQRTEPGGAGTGVTANAGYFYLAAYSPDQLAVRAHPYTGEAKLADCTACESVIARGTDALYPNLGTARFAADGLTAGFNPCGAIVPVLNTTWGSIKAYFRGDH